MLSKLKQAIGTSPQGSVQSHCGLHIPQPRLSGGPQRAPVSVSALCASPTGIQERHLCWSQRNGTQAFLFSGCCLVAKSFPQLQVK